MIIIIMGVSGSGKTTIGQQLAGDLGWHYIEGDDFHSAANIAKMSRGDSLTDDDRSNWLLQIAQSIRQHIDDRQHAVFSCSALKHEYRQQLRLDSKMVKFVYLKGSHTLIKKRLLSRTGHFMKAELLTSQFDTLEEPDNAMIVDIILTPAQISSAIQYYFSLPDMNR